MQFEYKCMNCGTRKERSESPLSTADGDNCPDCGTTMNTVRKND